LTIEKNNARDRKYAFNLKKIGMLSTMPELRIKKRRMASPTRKSTSCNVFLDIGDILSHSF
jgi:hypothetical protein